MTKVQKLFYFLWTFGKSTSCYPKKQQTQQKQHLRLGVAEMPQFMQNQGYVFAYKAHSGALPASYMR